MYRKKKKDFNLMIGRFVIPVRLLRKALAFIPVLLILIGCSKNRFYDHSVGDPLKADIVSVLPANLAGGVFVDPEVSVTYKDEVDIQTISSTVISLKKGNSEISGDLAVNGNMVSFIPDADLDNESEYTATVTTASHNPTDFESSHKYEWKFKTGKNHRIDSLSIVSVLPASAATQVPVGSPLIATFNHDLTASMMKSVFISLRKGTTNVNGVVSFTGKTATFQPSAPLLTGTVYNASVTIGSGHNSDNNIKSASWSFTTEGTAADFTPPTVVSVLPLNNAVSVANNAKVSATFSEPLNPVSVSATTFTLKLGTLLIPGTVSYLASTATFTPSSPLADNTLYTATVTTGIRDVAGNNLASSYTWSFTTTAVVDKTPPTVVSANPANSSTNASTTTKLSVTFSEAMKQSTISASSFILKQGTTSVAGSITYTGTTATFTPSANLSASTVYTASITTAATDVAGNALSTAYNWTFTTAAMADVTPPSISSVSPLSGASSVAVFSKVTATFSEPVDASTLTASTFTLKQGTVSVAGTISISGSTVTFTPSAALAGNTVYTATLTNGVKDLSGNAMSANYTWNFTTAMPADMTPPTVSSVLPVSGATSVAMNSTVSVVFSEPVMGTSVTASTFIVKQGSTGVAGAVTLSGSTATFTPSAALSGNTVYTCTLTTGVMDMAGNAMVSQYSWSFTTVATVTGKSFANDVAPILNLCNTCHTHNWTASPTASTFYANLVSAGYVNTTAPTSGKIYTKLTGGHPPGSTVSAAQVTTVLTWITEGSKNN